MARTPKHFYIRAGAWRRFAPPEIVLYDDDLDDDLPDDGYADQDESFYDDAPGASHPLWTRRRVILAIVVIIILVTFLAYSFQGFFIPPPPPPTIAPGSLI